MPETGEDGLSPATRSVLHSPADAPASPRRKMGLSAKSKGAASSNTKRKAKGGIHAGTAAGRQAKKLLKGAAKKGQQHHSKRKKTTPNATSTGDGDGSTEVCLIKIPGSESQGMEEEKEPTASMVIVAEEPGDIPKKSRFPLARVAVIGCVLFANRFSSLIIFPFLPFMIHDFFPNTPMSQLGTYAGILGSAFAVGGLSGSIYWGRAADKHGRRPILITGLIGTVIATFLFGLSPTFAAAVFFRALWGLLNGNVGVAKAYLSEICDDSNQAKAFSVIGLAASLGRLTGPAVGAFLAHPVENVPSLFAHSVFLERFPYFLPCFVGVVVCVLCIGLAFRYLQETVPHPQPFRIGLGWLRQLSSWWKQHRSSSIGWSQPPDGTRQGSRAPSAESRPKRKVGKDVAVSFERNARGDTHTTVQEGSLSKRKTATSKASATTSSSSASAASVVVASQTSNLSRSQGLNAQASKKHGRQQKSKLKVSSSSTSSRDTDHKDMKARYSRHDESYGDDGQDDSIINVRNPVFDDRGRDTKTTTTRGSAGRDKRASSFRKKTAKSQSAADARYASKKKFDDEDSGDTSDSDVISIDDSMAEPLLPMLQPPQSRTTLQLAMDRRIGLSTCLYGLIAFISIIVQEVIPLYWLTGPELSGLNLSMQDMGKMMLYSGPLQFVTQITLFPYLSKKLGYKLLYQSSLVCYCFMLLAIPELHRISPPRPAAPGALVTSPGVHTLYHHHHHHHHHHHFEQHLDDGSAGVLGAINASSTSSSAPPLVDETEGYLIPSKYYLLLPSLLYATMISTSQLTFTSTFVLISNSSPTHERGAANGLGQTYASFARVAGPLVGGALFAWSERNGLPWPLDFHFVWYLEIATVFLALYVAMYLPSDANQRRGT